MFRYNKLATSLLMTGFLIGQSNSFLTANADVKNSNADTDKRLKDGELRMAKRAEVARLHLNNGSTLYFIEVKAGAIGVLEMQARGVASIASVKELGRDATPTDLFFAFSEEGTKIPGRLSKTALPATNFGPQGWARGLLDIAPVGRAPCNDTDVRTYVNNFGYNDRNTPKFRLNQKPKDSGYFIDYVENWEPGYFFYEYSVGGNTGSVWSNVDRYITYVAVCAIDTHDSRNPGNKAHPAITIECDFQNPNTPGVDLCYVNNHMGPQVHIRYREQNTGGAYKSVVSKDFAASEVGTSVRWHFNSGTDWDWRTEIHWAGGDDVFDIAHAVEDL